MKKIKILRIIARLNIGGPAIHVVLLSAGLDKSRFETVLACGCLGRGEGESQDAGQAGIKPYIIGPLGRELNFFADLAAFVKIFNLIRKVRPDIIHTHTAKAGTLGRLAGILHNIFSLPRRRAKLIHTFHGHIFSGYFNVFSARAFILIERILSAFSSKIITVSESVKKELVSLGVAPAEKIEVILLGFDLSGLLSVLPPSDEPKIIGIVGRLVPVKNHRLFLEAAAQLFDVPGLKFKVIGDGELRSKLENYARELGLSDKVIFLGWQKGLVDIYAQLDIVVLTSFNEGTPVSLIEAMACGRPVVATDVGGVGDLLGGAKTRQADGQALFEIRERGLAVHSGDSASLAFTLRYLLREKQMRERLSRDAREFVRNKFTKERLVGDIEKLYLDMLNQ